jgi:hypothetical protein
MCRATARRKRTAREPGKTLPIGISAFEDKRVEDAVRELLEGSSTSPL